VRRKSPRSGRQPIINRCSCAIARFAGSIFLTVRHPGVSLRFTPGFYASTRCAGFGEVSHHNLIRDSLRKRSGELKANRRWHLDYLSRRAELASPLVNPEHNDVIGFLICHQQKRSAGIDGKVAWRHASSGFVANRDESTVARVNCENGNAVVTPVRTIEKSPIRGNVDIGTRVCPREILRQSG